MAFKRISVLGLGYIGLPTAAMFASRKVEVIGIDVNRDTVNTINEGNVHIVEPDLDILVRSTVQEGYLRASVTAEPAEAFLIAVPTPFKEGNQPDLSYIQSAAEMIAPVLEKGNLVVLESTSPVGATEQLEKWLAEIRQDLKFPSVAGEDADIAVAHCPERVLPGQVIRELVENDRIIGGITERCSEKSIELYKTFVKGECISTSSRTAEMAKLTENSFRDVNIAFANELSILCHKFDIDTRELIALANRHPRVNILQPGTGVGGHCIAVDPWFIVAAGGSDARIIRTAREVNDDKTVWVKNQILKNADKFYEEAGREPVIACLGLAFKPDIDDLRESPALAVYQSLVLAGKRVLAVEPNLDSHESIQLTSIDEALIKADIVVYLVAHNEFKNLSFETKSLDFCGASSNI